MLVDVLALDEAAFKTRYRGSPIHRIGRDRLIRNACIAAGNGRVEVALPPLTALLDDPNPLVRGHAAWALAQFEAFAAAQTTSPPVNPTPTSWPKFTHLTCKTHDKCQLDAIPIGVYNRYMYG